MCKLLIRVGCCLLCSSIVHAKPKTPKVVHGEAQFHSKGHEFNVTTSHTCVIHWKDFSIDAHEKMAFLQPNAQSAVLNKVLGGNMSEIMGRLEANGKVFIINPSGMIIGPQGVIQAASFVFSTRDLSLEDFLKNTELRFKGASDAAWINLGNVQSTEGSVVILAHRIEQKGTIEATDGVHLATGREVILHMDHRQGLRITASSDEGMTTLEGKIRVNPYELAINVKEDAVECVEKDGRMLIQVKTKELKMSKESILETIGSIEMHLGNAISYLDGIMIAEKGDISLSGSSTFLFNKSLLHALSGNIDIIVKEFTDVGTFLAPEHKISIRAPEGITQMQDGKIEGGEIDLLAEKGTLFLSGSHEGETIRLSGKDVALAGASVKGDQIFLGGGVQGQDPSCFNAENVYLNASTTVNAHEGGSIVLFAKEKMHCEASVSAKDGFVELSGKELSALPKLEVDHGSLLIDPLNIDINSSTGAFPYFLFNPSDSGGGSFNGIVALTNGNVVVVNQTRTVNGHANAGAVYLYNGTTNALISALFGTNAGDQIGSSGIFASPVSANFVVCSSNWSNGFGAVTIGDGIVGFPSGFSISSSNSIIGSTSSPADNVGSAGGTFLSNGNFVIASPNWSNTKGAATWTDGTVFGPVSASNSLVGGVSGDLISNGTIYALTNGNFVVSSSFNLKGAMTWGNGSVGTVGIVSSSNSLVGNSVGDDVGIDGVAVLTNGNYVVQSTGWSGNKGAATWINGSNGYLFGTTSPGGVISASNSLIGNNSGDAVGITTPLSNGHYVVGSPSWGGSAGPGGSGIGVATWGNGTTGGVVGTVSQVASMGNGLTGSMAGDQVGTSVTSLLSNGHYVVGSPNWNVSFTPVGATTWGNGSTAGPRLSGAVSSANSLIGSSYQDALNQSILALANGNYVVSSPNWTDPMTSTPQVGAVTWNDGSTAGTSRVTGPISSTNSLVGSTYLDSVGYSVTGLFNGNSSGNYVVCSPNWTNTATSTANEGAVTWQDGSTAGTDRVVGPVSSANSLVGGSSSAGVGSLITELPTGDYILGSPNWNSGQGAATYISGAGRILGTISDANSLVGGASSQNLGASIQALGSNAYLVFSNSSRSFTWSPVSTPTTGTADASNTIFASGYGGLSSSSDDLVASSYLIAMASQAFSIPYNPTTISATQGLQQSGQQTPLNINPASIVYLLSGGTNVSLAAQNNITISSPLDISGNGLGNLTLTTTGTSGNIAFNANVTTGSNAFTAIAGNNITSGTVSIGSSSNGNLTFVVGNATGSSTSGLFNIGGATFQTTGNLRFYASQISIGGSLNTFPSVINGATVPTIASGVANITFNTAYPNGSGGNPYVIFFNQQAPGFVSPAQATALQQAGTVGPDLISQLINTQPPAPSNQPQGPTPPAPAPAPPTTPAPSTLTPEQQAANQQILDLGGLNTIGAPVGTTISISGRQIGAAVEAGEVLAEAGEALAGEVGLATAEAGATQAASVTNAVTAIGESIGLTSAETAVVLEGAQVPLSAEAAARAAEEGAQAFGLTMPTRGVASTASTVAQVLAPLRQARFAVSRLAQNRLAAAMFVQDAELYGPMHWVINDPTLPRIPLASTFPARIFVTRPELYGSASAAVYEAEGMGIVLPSAPRVGAGSVTGWTAAPQFTSAQLAAPVTGEFTLPVITRSLPTAEPLVSAATSTLSSPGGIVGGGLRAVRTLRLATASPIAPVPSFSGSGAAAAAGATGRQFPTAPGTLPTFTLTSSTNSVQESGNLGNMGGINLPAGTIFQTDHLTGPNGTTATVFTAAQPAGLLPSLNTTARPITNNDTILAQIVNVYNQNGQLLQQTVANQLPPNTENSTAHDIVSFFQSLLGLSPPAPGPTIANTTSNYSPITGAMISQTKSLSTSDISVGQLAQFQTILTNAGGTGTLTTGTTAYNITTSMPSGQVTNVQSNFTSSDGSTQLITNQGFTASGGAVVSGGVTSGTLIQKINANTMQITTLGANGVSLGSTQVKKLSDGSVTTTTLSPNGTSLGSTNTSTDGSLATNYGPDGSITGSTQTTTTSAGTLVTTYGPPPAAKQSGPGVPPLTPQQSGAPSLGSILTASIPGGASVTTMDGSGNTVGVQTTTGNPNSASGQTVTNYGPTVPPSTQQGPLLGSTTTQTQTLSNGSVQTTVQTLNADNQPTSTQVTLSGPATGQLTVISFDGSGNKVGQTTRTVNPTTGVSTITTFSGALDTFVSQQQINTANNINTVTNLDQNGNTLSQTKSQTLANGTQQVQTFGSAPAGTTPPLLTTTTSTNTASKTSTVNSDGITIAPGTTTTTKTTGPNNQPLGETVTTVSPNGTTQTTTNYSATVASNGSVTYTPLSIQTLSENGTTTTITNQSGNGSPLGSQTIAQLSNGTQTTNKAPDGSTLNIQTTITSSDGLTKTTTTTNGATPPATTSVQKAVTSPDGLTTTTTTSAFAGGPALSVQVATKSSDGATVTTTNKSGDGSIVLGIQATTTSPDGLTQTTKNESANGTLLNTQITQTSPDGSTVTVTNKNPNGGVTSIIQTTTLPDGSTQTKQISPTDGTTVLGIQLKTTSANGLTVTTTNESANNTVVGIQVATTSADGLTVTTTDKAPNGAPLGVQQQKTSADGTVTTVHLAADGTTILSTQQTRTSADGTVIVSNLVPNQSAALGSTTTQIQPDGSQLVTTYGPPPPGDRAPPPPVLGIQKVVTSPDGGTVTTTNYDPTSATTPRAVLNVVGTTTTTLPNGAQQQTTTTYNSTQTQVLQSVTTVTTPQSNGSTQTVTTTTDSTGATVSQQTQTTSIANNGNVTTNTTVQNGAGTTVSTMNTIVSPPDQNGVQTTTYNGTNASGQVISGTTYSSINPQTGVATTTTQNPADLSPTPANINTANGGLVGSITSTTTMQKNGNTTTTTDTTTPLGTSISTTTTTQNAAGVITNTANNIAPTGMETNTSQTTQLNGNSNTTQQLISPGGTVLQQTQTTSALLTNGNTQISSYVVNPAHTGTILQTTSTTIQPNGNATSKTMVGSTLSTTSTSTVDPTTGIQTNTTTDYNLNSAAVTQGTTVTTTAINPNGNSTKTTTATDLSGNVTNSQTTTVLDSGNVVQTQNQYPSNTPIPAAGGTPPDGTQQTITTTSSNGNATITSGTMLGGSLQQNLGTTIANQASGGTQLTTQSFDNGQVTGSAATTMTGDVTNGTIGASTILSDSRGIELQTITTNATLQPRGGMQLVSTTDQQMLNNPGFSTTTITNATTSSNGTAQMTVAVNGSWPDTLSTQLLPNGNIATTYTTNNSSGSQQITITPAQAQQLPATLATTTNNFTTTVNTLTANLNSPDGDPDFQLDASIQLQQTQTQQLQQQIQAMQAQIPNPPIQIVQLQQEQQQQMQQITTSALDATSPFPNQPIDSSKQQIVNGQQVILQLQQQQLQLLQGLSTNPSSIAPPPPGPTINPP